MEPADDLQLGAWQHEVEQEGAPLLREAAVTNTFREITALIDLFLKNLQMQQNEKRK
jgi:hypothetical protein